jgi:peptidoglycan L-alanyl-D-glutamate endopeptidase CwlK
MTQKEIDMRNAKELAPLMPHVRALAIDLIKRCAACNVPILVYCGMRTFEQQAKEFAKGRTILRTPEGKRQREVTEAQPGQSYHQYGIAFDCAPVINGAIDWSGTSAAWKTLGSIGMAIGFEWGGLWRIKDNPHFEYRNNVHWSALLATYKLSNGDLTKCWALVEKAGKR